MKVIKVCSEEDCNKNPYPVKVKSKRLVFCCKKGFEKSLEDFTNHLSNACEKCKEGTMKDTGKVLLSDPPQNVYKCDNCGFVKWIRQ